MTQILLLHALGTNQLSGIAMPRVHSKLWMLAASRVYRQMRNFPCGKTAWRNFLSFFSFHLLLFVYWNWLENRGRIVLAFALITVLSEYLLWL
mgnify:CR=1 FL=1